MAASIVPYPLAGRSLANAEVDLDSHTLKVMVVGSGYTPALDTHRYKSDVGAEVAGTGYTAGGVTLTGVTVTYDAATNTVKFDAADADWPTAAGWTGRYGVVYDATPATDATRPLLALVDFDGEVSPTAGFTIVWPAGGILTIAAP